MKNLSFAFPLVCLYAAPVLAQDLPSLVNNQLPGLIDTYKGIHAHPELSHHEERTSALLAAELRKIAKRDGIHLLGPNCLGFQRPYLQLNASVAGVMCAKIQATLFQGAI